MDIMRGSITPIPGLKMKIAVNFFQNLKKKNNITFAPISYLANFKFFLKHELLTSAQRNYTVL